MMIDRWVTLPTWPASMDVHQPGHKCTEIDRMEMDGQDGLGDSWREGRLRGPLRLCLWVALPLQPLIRVCWGNGYVDTRQAPGSLG